MPTNPAISWWVSCNTFTVSVKTYEGRIVESAPFVKKFIGQPLDNLLKWARQFGGLEYRRIL